MYPIFFTVFGTISKSKSSQILKSIEIGSISYTWFGI
jgi:hypothetical protein